MFLHPITWPNGKQSAASITFDIDADSLVHVGKPKDSQLRLQPQSAGRYGPTVAIPRILETYRRLELTQTFFMPGWVMERYPETVESILKGGHEIGHHSWAHEDPLDHSDEKEAELFGKANDTHIKMTGHKPIGYRAPVYNVTPAIVNRLIEHDFLYDTSMMADDLPYEIVTSKGSIIELPPHWGNDDWPPFAHMEELDYVMPVRSPSEGVKAFIEEFDAMHEAGGFWMPVLHPFLTGRLARWRQMERHLERMVEQGDVWIAPMKEIAAHARAQGAGLRRDTLDF